jgi:hypothetical protein
MEPGRDRAATVVRGFLDARADEGLVTLLGATDRAFDVMVPSYWKESIAATLEIGERSLRAEAFFMRAPEDDTGRAYRVLLERNERSRAWRFAASETGDVWLVADVPLAAVDEEALDQLLGGLVTMVDETYRPYFRVAFAAALAAQVAAGGPGIDAAPPWARDPERPPPNVEGP